MFDENIPSLEDLKKKFKKELEGVNDINDLKELYATEIARRDQLVIRLQEQNKVLLASSIRAKSDELQK